LATIYECIIKRNLVFQVKSVNIYLEGNLIGEYLPEYGFQRLTISFYQRTYHQPISLFPTFQFSETNLEGETINFNFRRISSSKAEIFYGDMIFLCDFQINEMRSSKNEKLAKMKIDREWYFRRSTIQIFTTEYHEFIIYCLLYIRLREEMFDNS
jgi:hypothetical protein